jgi:hypothetical protein
MISESNSERKGESNEAKVYFVHFFYSPADFDFCLSYLLAVTGTSKGFRKESSGPKPKIKKAKRSH